MDGPRPIARRTQPLFALAAAEVARHREAGAPGAISGLEETIVDLLQDRAVELYADGLLQYAALRVGDLAAARAVMDELRAQVAAEGKERVERARLYRFVRGAARRARARGAAASTARTALPWRTPRAAAGRGYAAIIDRLRDDALPPAQAELLELRHARELEADEIAFVLDEPPEAVAEALARAEAHARAALAEPLAAGEASLGEALVEAFALDVGAAPPAPPAPESAGVAPLLPAGALIGGRYRVEACVGSGSFGDVYRALDIEVAGHVVALKLLHQEAHSEEARALGLRELRIIASVFHPSIVQFKDFGWHERRLWFVMPWYDGETLETRIAREPLDRREARRFFEPLARALATMHAAGIRHQDVKPDNVFLARIRGFGQGAGEEGEEVLPVLLDLGVAATEAEMLLAGTPTYFAPEVAHLYAFLPSPPPIGPKADVFSLALSLRNALEPETQDDVPAGALEAFVKRRATKGPTLPQRKELQYLRRHFERWLAVDPDERPTADELAEELRVLTEPEERRERRRAVLRWLLPGGLAVLSLFLAVTLWLGSEARARQREAAAAADRAMLFQSRYEDAKARFQRKALSSDELLRELATAEARGDALTADLEETQRALALSRERRRALTREVYETGQRLGDARQSLLEAEAELSEARETLAARERELEAQRGELAERARAVSRLEGDVAERERRAEELGERVATLESALVAARAERERLDRALREARAAEVTAPDPDPAPAPAPAPGPAPERPVIRAGGGGR